MITQVNLLNNIMIVFQVSLNFDSVKEILKKAMSYLYFNEESDYSEENTSENEDLCSTILQSFQCVSKQKKTCEKKNCKNEGRVIDCLCCREVCVMLISLAKISECVGSISPSNFYEQLPDC